MTLNPLLWVLAAPWAMAVADGAGTSVGQLKLQQLLDRPQDGYCLDVVGSGEYIRFDMPLTAHNCKPGLYQDEAVSLTPEGAIYFPAYQRCVTAAGLNGRAVQGASLLIRECGEQVPFMDAAPLQRFDFLADGRVRLKGSDLCLTAGPQSDRTFSAEHRWRALYLDSCEMTDHSRNRWRFHQP